MRAIIFGASGQLGRALAAAAPADATILALTSADCDITDAEAVPARVREFRPDLMFNAAAYTAVDLAESEAARAEQINAHAPGVMAAAAESGGARMIHVSTDYVFDGERGDPWKPDDPMSPQSVYGRTKAAGERAVLANAPTALIVRTSWVYASQGRNFVSSMLNAMATRNEVGVVADQVGTPTHARSLAEALWALAQRECSGTLHYTDSGVASWYDFAVAIQEEAIALGLLSNRAEIRPIRTEEYPTPARRPGYSVLEKSATWQLLGRAAPHWRVNLRACLRERIECQISL